MSLLTVLQVADSLAAKPIDIDRAIAIGELEANRVGANGPYRIEEAALTAWGKRGYPRFDSPPVSGDWYDKHDRNSEYQMGLFASAIQKELAEWADEQPEPAAGVSEVAAPITAAMRSLAVAAVPPLASRLHTKKTPPTPYASRLESAFVYAIRSAAARIVRVRDSRRDPLQVLFKSREDFAQITAESFIEASSSRIAVRRIFTSTGPVTQPARFVNYNITLGDLITANRASYAAKIINIAF